jgi:la-related protein 1
LYFSKNGDSDFELDDDDIDKILIITPTPPSNRKQHQQNYEHTGEHIPRARMTPEVARIIEDGLRWYEEELWHDRSKPVKLKNQTQANNERKLSANEEEVTNQSIRPRGENDENLI